MDNNNLISTGVRMAPKLKALLKIQAIKEGTNFQSLVSRVCWDYLEKTVPELIEAKEKRIAEALNDKSEPV
jgi:hypothetical protein